MKTPHESGPCHITGPFSIAFYSPQRIIPQKWLIALNVDSELADAFGILRTVRPAVIDDFGNLVVV